MPTKPRFCVAIQSLGLIAWLLASFAAGAVGGAASIQAADFFGQLLRPA